MHFYIYYTIKIKKKINFLINLESNFFEKFHTQINVR